jgi:hypothetical protein
MATDAGHGFLLAGGGITWPLSFRSSRGGEPGGVWVMTDGALHPRCVTTYLNLPLRRGPPRHFLVAERAKFHRVGGSHQIDMIQPSGGDAAVHALVRGRGRLRGRMLRARAVAGLAGNDLVDAIGPHGILLAVTRLTRVRTFVYWRVRGDLGHRVGSVVAVDAERFIDEDSPSAKDRSAKDSDKKDQADNVFGHSIPTRQAYS